MELEYTYTYKYVHAFGGIATPRCNGVCKNVRPTESTIIVHIILSDRLAFFFFFCLFVQRSRYDIRRRGGVITVKSVGRSVGVAAGRGSSNGITARASHGRACTGLGPDYRPESLVMVREKRFRGRVSSRRSRGRDNRPTEYTHGIPLKHFSVDGFENKLLKLL